MTTTGNTSDPNRNNNVATARNVVITSADLVVTKSASPDPVQAGGLLTYTLSLTNSGPSDARALMLSDAIPAGTTFDSAMAPQGWLKITPPQGAMVTITITTPSLAPGSSATFTIVVKVPAGTTRGIVITSFANATTTSPKRDPHNISINQITVGAPPSTNPPPGGGLVAVEQGSLASPIKGATSTGSNVSRAQDAVLATSGGLVADVLRQGTLSGLLGSSS